MPVDMEDLEDEAGLAAEICIVGAGVAGQTLAKTLADRGRDDLLGESGGVDFDEEIQALNRADDIGLPFYDLYRARPA